MSNFFLPPDSPFAGTLVQVPHILNPRDLLAFRPFTDWLATLSKSLALQQQQQQQQSSSSSSPSPSPSYRLHSITIQAVDFFPPTPATAPKPRIGFLKLQADIAKTDATRESLPGAVFMRGGSVAVLVILTPSEASSSHEGGGLGDDDDEYVVLTVQPRIATGSLAFVELPAGMIDAAADGLFAGAAAREIKEETGLEIRQDELLDLTKLALQSAASTSSGEGEGEGEQDEQQQHALLLRDALYTSPGASDEFIPILAVRKTLSRSEIERLRGKKTGLREEGEKITLKLVKLRDLWKVGARDAKTVAAWALWQGLKAEGKV